MIGKSIATIGLAGALMSGGCGALLRIAGTNQSNPRNAAALEIIGGGVQGMELEEYGNSLSRRGSTSGVAAPSGRPRSVYTFVWSDYAGGGEGNLSIFDDSLYFRPENERKSALSMPFSSITKMEFTDVQANDWPRSDHIYVESVYGNYGFRIPRKNNITSDGNYIQARVGR